MNYWESSHMSFLLLQQSCQSVLPKRDHLLGCLGLKAVNAMMTSFKGPPICSHCVWQLCHFYILLITKSSKLWEMLKLNCYLSWPIPASKWRTLGAPGSPSWPCCDFPTNQLQWWAEEVNPESSWALHKELRQLRSTNLHNLPEVGHMWQAHQVGVGCKLITPPNVGIFKNLYDLANSTYSTSLPGVGS